MQPFDFSQTPWTVERVQKLREEKLAAYIKAYETLEQLGSNEAKSELRDIKNMPALAPAALRRALDETNQFKMSVRMPQIASLASGIPANRLESLIEQSVVGVAAEKFGSAAMQSAPSAGYFVYAMDPARDSVEFVRSLTQRLNGLPAGFKLVLVGDSQKLNLKARSELRDRMVREFRSEITAGRLVVPNFNTDGWDLKQEITERTLELGIPLEDVIRIAGGGNQTQTRYAQSVYLGIAVPLLLRAGIVVAGSDQNIGKVREMDISEIVLVAILAASHTKHSA